MQTVRHTFETVIRLCETNKTSYTLRNNVKYEKVNTFMFAYKFYIKLKSHYTQYTLDCELVKCKTIYLARSSNFNKHFE